MSDEKALAGINPLRPPGGVYLLHSPDFAAWVYPFGARLMQVWWLTAPLGPRPLSLGFNSPTAYHQDTMAMGAVCGRYGNRIAAAQLLHNGQQYALSANHPLGHCIHGGELGFGVRNWSVASHSERHIELTLHSAHGDQGFPGNCDARIVYAWVGNNLQWSATAALDAPCPINLIPHPYWNLDASPTVANHRLQVFGSHYLPLDDQELPLPLASVDGTAFDYRSKRLVCAPHFEERIAHFDGAVLLDTPHNASRATPSGIALGAVASVDDLQLSVYTDQPFVHLYGASGLRPTEPHLGVAHQSGAGLCLETETWPNGPALGRAVWHDKSTPYSHTAHWVFEAC